MLYKVIWWWQLILDFENDFFFFFFRKNEFNLIHVIQQRITSSLAL